MTVLEVFGWIGSAAFAICGLPQAYKSWKDGHSKGLSTGLITLWWIGEVFSLIYVAPTKQWPLLFNFIGNLIFISVMTWYKLFPRKRKK